MADKMDRGLDEIIADNRSNGPRSRRGGGRRRERERQEYPRDGVRKRMGARSIRREQYCLASPAPTSLNSRFLDSRRAPAPRRRRDSPDDDTRGSKIRVENIHYDLTEEDLEELFSRIGRVSKLQLRYDRAGRSDGVAFVIYERKEDATEAIRQFDGANANGQPIRLSLMAGSSSRNPFDTAVMPGRPLSERVSAPGGRSRSYSPRRRTDEDDAARKGIDRYVPGGASRSRSPMPRRRGGGGGRRPGARRDGGGRDGAGARDQEGGRGGRGNPRTKKTQEELDAEMEDYFGGGGEGSAPAPAAAASGAANPATGPAAVVDDIDMIE
ncbi:hypothetical protein S40285_03410 [Stachybotrys chlorohalonatus IBT 40285]|uniref:RRM domain-containing protein n=1 Tax=Stachybotrys chlorohalonatus (strain IBT 40285) TaxID=1283841 RepID=A0A084QBX3_STAC4|nr:hypothetical protein S40285_03410 [Stachybotrys chlorohalonata IBT 40285]